MLTLNQIIKRIKTIALAHKQIRNFYFGVPTDFLTDKTTRYASAFLQDTPGTIDVAAKSFTIGFRLWLLDLVNVSQNAKENELDVQSDMASVAMDLLASFDYNGYTDWKVGTGSGVELLREAFDDLVAGASIDFTITVPWNKDVCAIPTDDVLNTEDMKLVYDTVYITTGSEGSTLSVPVLVGNKLLLVIRENSPLHKVSSAPASAEYTWNDVVITLGTPVNPETTERFLFLYRSY